MFRIGGSLSALSRIGLALVMLVAWLAAVPPAASAQPACTFTLGFKLLRDQIPQIVGQCLENEWHNAENGDGLQQTTGGLLVWRKADNWTAFTDGSTTWINGPFGLQTRPNAGPLFPWEAPPTVRQIQVFFSRHPESDDDFTAVFPVARTSPDQGVASSALEQLIAGPTAAERAAGYFSELSGMLRGPSDCGADFSLRIEEGLATLRFCRQVVSAGVGQDARVQAQIGATLRQFPTVQRIRLLASGGDCLFDQSGLNVCLR